MHVDPRYLLYREFHDVRVHEDNLLNHRLTWLLVAQSILVTAWAAMTTLRPAHSTVAYILAAGAVAFVGMAMCVAVGGAMRAGFQTTELWRDTLQKLASDWGMGEQPTAWGEDKTAACMSRLPHIVRYQEEARARFAQEGWGRANRALVWVPRILLAMWILLVALTVGMSI